MPSPPVNVLLVDDDPLARQIIGGFLADGGCHVVLAVDVPSAVAAMEVEKFDVVVTDLLLPGGDGLQVLAHAKRRDPDVEVIVITALERVDPAVRAIKGGAADYLIKPVAPEALQLSISRCLSKRQLLRHNETLRAHLSLLDAGQRLATTLDRDTLFPMAVEALTQSLSAKATLLFARRTDGSLALVGQFGWTEDEAGRATAEALPELARDDREMTSVRIDGVPHALLLADEGEQSWGACLFKDPALDGPSWANATYLMRQLAIALKNLDRFSAVEDLAYLDDLTRLYNTRYLHVALDREVGRARQNGSPFSVLFMDLDHFKAVNDTHGHLAGSKVLVEMAALLKGCVRDVDVVVRYGGDEYVIVLIGTDEGGALKVAERIRRTVELHRFLARDGLDVTLTVCVGLASSPHHASDKQQILELADRAMYRGKRSTRNVVYVASAEVSHRAG